MKNGRKTVFSILLCLCMVLQFAPSAAFAVDAAESGLCAHHTEHTAECGYAAAVEAHECHYECAECANSESTAVCDCGTDDPAIHATTCAVYVAPENPMCYCAEKCTEANVWCDVCGFDYTACTGTDRSAGYGTGWTIEETNLIVTGHLTALPEGVDYSEIEVHEGGNLDLGEATVTCNVDNFYGTISSGTFNTTDPVSNYSIISGGTFHADVNNEYGATISGGTFTREVRNDGTISGGDFISWVINKGTITGGTIWYGTVSNKESGTISNAKFESNAKLAAGSTPPQSVIHSVNGKDVALTYNAPLPAALGEAEAWYQDLTQVTGGTVPLNYTNYVGEYKISTAAATNGTVSVPATAKYGQTVTVTATAFGGYALDTVTVQQGETAVTVTDNAFTMPAGDVTVSAAFARCNHSGSEHTTATNNGDGTHSFECSVCGETGSEAHNYKSGTSAGACVCGAACPHSNFDSATGNCTDCETSLAIAKVEIGGNTTYYQTAYELSTAIENNSADQAITLLANFEVIRDLCFYAGEAKNTLDLNGHTLTGSSRIDVEYGELTITGTGSINIFMTADDEGTKIVVGSGVTLNNSLRSVYGGVLDLTNATIPEAGLNVILYSDYWDPTTYNVSDVLLLPEDYYFFVDGKAAYTYSGETEGTVLKHTEHSYTYTNNGDGTHAATCSACGAVVDNEAHTPDADGYTVGTDGTHSYTCTVCDATVTEEHTYVDGTCACGLVKTYTVTFNPYGDSGAKIVEINGEAKEILHGGTFTVPHGQELKVKFENTLSKWETGVYCDGYVFIDQNLIMCNYNEATNTLTIPGNKVTGDFVIGVDAYVRVQFNLHGGTLTDDGRELLVELFGYTWNAETSTLKAGYGFNFALRPEYFQLAGHTLAGAKVDGSEEVVQQLEIRSDMTVDILWECDGTAILTPVPAKGATCMEAGNIAHYVCTCGKLYEDEAGTKELTAEDVKTDIDPTNHVENGFDSATGKCACGLEMAGAKVTSAGVDTYYEILKAALADAKSGDTVTLCKSARITDDHTIPAGVTFVGGEYSVSNVGTGMVTNNGTIASGEFDAYVQNNGTVSGGDFTDTLVNGGTVTGGSFSRIDCHSGSTLSGSFQFNLLVCFEECTMDLSNATVDGSAISNNKNEELTAGSLNLPEGYALKLNNNVVSALSAGETGFIESHTHTYETRNNKTHHWTVCACGKTTAQEEHTYTYADNGDNHTVGCSACDFSKTEPHAMGTATGKCVCGLEMAGAKVTSAGVDTYYEILKDALAAASDGDTVTLCADVNIGITAHTIPAGVNFSGGEYTVSGEGAGWIYNDGTIEDGVFAFFVRNYGTIKGGEFYSAVNSGTVIGGSFQSVDCERASSLSGPVSVSDLTYSGECSIDLIEASFDSNTHIVNATAQDLPVSELHLPEGYEVQLEGSVVSVLPSYFPGYIVLHAHTYDESGFSDTYHWQICDCGKTTAQEEHTYTYADNGDNHTVGCSVCDFSKTEPHAMGTATGKCACGVDMAAAGTTVSGTTTYYETLKDAIAAAAVGTKDAPATVTVLKNIDITETIQVSSGVFTLKLNGKTLRDYEGDGLFDGIFYLPSDSTAHMTIADAAGGKLLADWRVVEVHGGTVTITGGNLSYAGVTILGNSVSAYGGTLNISGGTIDGIGARYGSTVNISGGSIESIHLSEHITANISGGSIMHLLVEFAESNVNLSGGEFMTVDCREKKVSELLVDGYSYWTLDGTTMLNPEYDTDLNDVIVKATCLHPAEKLTYVTSDSSTHTWECSDCNNNITEAHTEPPTYTLTADGAQHIATYACCGGTVTEGHSIIPETGKCACGVDMAVAAVTIGGNTTYAETLQAAINAIKSCTASDHAKITLLQSVALGSERLNVDSGVFVLDLNGCTLSGGHVDGVLYITGGDVTLTDSGEGGTATNTGSTHCVVVVNGGIINISGTVSISGNKGVMVRSGTANITGGNFTTSGLESCGVRVEGGTANIRGGTITSGKYGVYAGENGVAVISDGTISDTYSGVYVNQGAAIISGGTITGRDYGIFLYQNGSATVNGGTISGTLYVDGTLTLGLGSSGVGATFADGIAVEKSNLQDILSTAASVGYWAVVDGKNTMLNVDTASVAITDKGDITVKVTCTHPESSRTDYTPLEDGKHSYLCSLCQNTLTEDHTTVSAATCANLAVCGLCGEYGEKDAANHEETVAYDNGFCPHGCYEPAVLNGEVYEISNAGQLYWFAAKVNAGETAINGKLMANIVVNTGDVSGCGGAKQSSWRDWTPIGTDNYNGTFEGNNKTVSGLYCNNSSTGWVGLFSCVNRAGVVQNVGVINSYISGYSAVGGVVGGNYGTVINCYNSGTIIGYYSVGGVAGLIEGTKSGQTVIGGIMTGCYNSGTVTGDDYAGGVVGKVNSYATVTNCHNSSTVSGTMRVGGVAAYNHGTVISCHNSGTVIGTGDDDKLGGIAGVVNDNFGTVTNCYNSGTVSGNMHVAGVVNDNRAILTNCYNLGTVIGNKYIAGLVFTNYGTIASCYNFGTVTGNAGVSGALCYNNSTITNCYYLNTTAGVGVLDEESNNADAAGLAEAKTAEQFASGEVAYLLQGEQTEQVWGQDIGTDDYPDFVSARVYYGYTSCGDTGMKYTNDSAASQTKPDHTGALGTPVPTGDGTQHVATWSCCGNTVTGPHTLALTYVNLDADGHKAYYPCCQQAEDVEATGHEYENGCCVCTDVKEFTLSFYASDGDETPVATFSVPYGTELIRLEEDEDDNVTFLGATDYLNALIGQIDTSTLKKEHYTFRSWDLETGPESMYKDESIFGIWDPVSYGITWDLAGGYAQYPEELPTVYDYGYGPMLWTGFAREGYTLSHFTDQYGQAYTLYERSDHYSMEPILPGGNLTLTAVWDVNAYILHAQDQSLDVDYGTALTDALSGIAPEKTGYTLTGWKFYLDEGCTEEYTGTTMPAYSVYAQPAFEPIQYNITWELNGCTVDSYVSHALPETLPYNGDADHRHQVKIFLNAPEGYTFTGFRDGNGNELEYSMANSWLFLTVTGDMTVEAIVEPNTYMATWDNGDGGSYDVGVKYGEVITVPTSEFFQDTFRKAGYTLVGWEGYTEGMTMPIGGVTIKAKWHINPASLAVPSGKYTGEAHAPAVTVAGLTEGEDFTVSYPADMTNVGEKIITVSGKHGGSVTVTYTIEKADPPVITFPEVLNSITYGQMLEDAKLSFYENEYGTFNWTAPIGVPNAGTNGYALDFYPEDLTNYDWAACNWQTHNATWIESRSALCAMGQVQVDKAEPVYTAPTAIEGLVYTGSSQELISVSEVQVEGGELLLSRDGNIYSQNLPAETDAGEYTVWYYVRGDDNHNDSAKKSVSVTIARKELTATVTGSMTKSYDGTDQVPAGHSLFITLDGVVAADMVSASADFAFAGVDAGTKTIKATNITLSGEDAKNYTLKSTSASADVGQIIPLDMQRLEPHDYSIVFGSNPVYTGKEQTVTVESFVMCGMDVTYELTGNTGTEAGTYTMTVTATGNFAGTVEEGWQITRKPVTITAKDQTVTYGDAISGAEIASVGLIEGHSVTATLTPSTANVTANGSIIASAAVITADGTDVTANYEIAYVDGKLVIEPDTSGIDDLTAGNVTSANEADIKAVQEMLENADSVKDEWAATDDKCSQLLDRIDEVEAEQKELTDAAADFDPETVKSTEKEDLEQLAEDIEALLDTENLTEDERDGLETVLEQVNDMIDTVEDAAEASKDATEAIDARDPATVTSADEDELEQAIGTIDKLLQDDHLTEEERNALEDAKVEAEALIDVIEKAQDAASTENTEKVENVTPENVKPEDKADLEKAKTDLEKALEDNGGNYTEEEKKSVEDEIDRIEAAVAALENAEDVTASIAQLPESVEPDDEAAAEKILAAKEAYDALTDHEKSLVDEASREKLDELVAALIAYDIIKGDGSEWIKGSDGSLSFTANGPFSKFVGIEVDGEEVDAKHYEAKSGSTIITLKQSFLMNLAAGEHTLTVIYTDGETSGTFRIHTKSLTPTTGDDSRILLYASMLTVSLAALAVLLPAARKRKKENS